MVAAGFTGGQAEELRRALGFKRSVRRMKQIEVQLREGMARQGITGEAADQIATSIRSFALYGFPESHAASFALLAYASAYLKVHYPAAFYAGVLTHDPGMYPKRVIVGDATLGRTLEAFCRFAHDQGVTAKRMTPEDLGKFYVRTSNGEMAPFSAFSTSPTGRNGVERESR